MARKRKGNCPAQTSTHNSYLALTYTPDSFSSRGSTSSEDRRPNIQRRLPEGDIDSSPAAPLEDATSILIADLRIHIEEHRIALAQTELKLSQTELKLSTLISQQAGCDMKVFFPSVTTAIHTLDKAIVALFQDDGQLRTGFKALTARVSDISAQLSAFKAETSSQLSSLKTQSTATPQQQTYASVASSGTRPVQQSAGPPRHVASGSTHCAFVAAGSHSDMASIVGLRGNDLSHGLAALIRQRLSLPPGSIHIVDAYPLGRVLPTDPPSKRHRFFFRVERLADADLVVRHRHVLKGSELVIFDELSSAERTSHQALGPSVTAARSLGLKVQFKRARLFVTSKSSTYQVVL